MELTALAPGSQPEPGDGCVPASLKAALDTLETAQKTLQAIAQRYPNEVFGIVSGVWAGLEPDQQSDNGMGLHVLWERYKEQAALAEK
jgi:hypothetical protein